MRITRLSVLLLLSLFLVSNLSASRIQSIKDLHPTVKDSAKGDAKSKSKDLKPFKKLIKDKVVIEGLFTFYQDTVDLSVLMAITPEQMGPIFLIGESLTESEGAFFDNGTMRATWPFYFKKVGKKILMLEKNLRLRADSTSTLSGAVDATISDHLFGSAAIKSHPQDSTKAILIDASALFVRDGAGVGRRLRETGFGLDKKNSHFGNIRSYPENSEVDVRLHYRTSKPQRGITLQDGRSMFHTYHYSLSSMPETDYVPRVGDDRIGYFMTIYQDYTSIETESPYVRYIDRWHLKKKNEDYDLSEPVEPIVFWIENTVPEQYRPMVKAAIEWFWS